MDERIKYLNRVIGNNEVELQDARDALDHHLDQLRRLGATLEDDVCAVLRKVIAQAEARQELREISDLLKATSPF